jgi:hypothetical protein
MARIFQCDACKRIEDKATNGFPNPVYFVAVPLPDLLTVSEHIRGAITHKSTEYHFCNQCLGRLADAVKSVLFAGKEVTYESHSKK